MTLPISVHKNHTFEMFVSFPVSSAAKRFPGHTYPYSNIQVNTKIAGTLVVRNVASTTSIATVLYFYHLLFHNCAAITKGTISHVDDKLV